MLLPNEDEQCLLALIMNKVVYAFFAAVLIFCSAGSAAAQGRLIVDTEVPEEEELLSDASELTLNAKAVRSAPQPYDDSLLRAVVRSQRALRAYAEVLIYERPNIRSVSFMQDGVSLEYASPCSLLAFIPFTCSFSVGAYFDGSSSVQKSWWFFLASDEATIAASKTESRMQELNESGLLQQMLKDNEVAAQQHLLRVLTTVFVELFEQ